MTNHGPVMLLLFLLNIMLIYDEPLLSGQPPLAAIYWYPEGGRLM